MTSSPGILGVFTPEEDFKNEQLGISPGFAPSKQVFNALVYERGHENSPGTDIFLAAVDPFDEASNDLLAKEVLHSGRGPVAFVGTPGVFAAAQVYSPKEKAHLIDFDARFIPLGHQHNVTITDYLNPNSLPQDLVHRFTAVLAHHTLTEESDFVEKVVKTMLRLVKHDEGRGHLFLITDAKEMKPAELGFKRAKWKPRHRHGMSGEEAVVWTNYEPSSQRLGGWVSSGLGYPTTHSLHSL